MVVPNGWTEKSLLECCYLLQGLTYSPSDVQSYGLLVLRSSNIQDGRLDFNDCVYVNCSIDEIKYVKPNDILICVRNGSSALIGKSCVIDQGYDATFGAFMSVLRGDTTGYIAHVFKSDLVQRQIRNRSSATINQITKRDFEDIKILVPNDAKEQCAIASALSDADKYITSLENLIAKKRAIKQGAMQELLMGNRRLPGFKGDWEERKLGDVCDKIISGKSVEYFSVGSFPVYGSTGVLGYTDMPMYSGKTILTARVGSVGTINVVKGKYGVSDNTLIVSPQIVDLTFIYYLLLISNIRRLTIGSSQPLITGKQLSEVIISIPQENFEQTAIATVLSDMDAEIDALTAKLKKARQIKQGMMSELLTGRIRLIQEETDNGENKRNGAEDAKPCNCLVPGQSNSWV